MKITKRILAILTALVLCLAPMALMAGAAEQNECTQHIFTPPIPDNAASAHYASMSLATPQYCPPIVYVGCPKICTICGYTIYVNYTATDLKVEHRFVTKQSPVNGAYYEECSFCGYDK